MADGGFPNKNRAINAYDAYGDAMRSYIAQVLERAHGPGWVHSRLLTDDLRKNNGRRYDEVVRALRSKKPPLEILDRGDIPNLVNGDLANFPDLSRDDARSLFTIRNLRNDIVHSGRSGDCTVEQANAIASLCILALERCGLSDAAESIRRISLVATPAAQATPEADLREQRERREWDKARLAGKPPDYLTPWEQQRLSEIEWEEEWERRELVRSEREEIAGFGDDIDGLRSWFDADEARHGRHPSEHTTLLQQEQERREQREREQRKREREERERREQEQKAHERREQERKERERRERERLEWREREPRERERAELAAFGDDIDGLRRWFTAITTRVERHPAAYATLVQREQQRAAQRRREREQDEPVRPERRERGQFITKPRLARAELVQRVPVQADLAGIASRVQAKISAGYAHSIGLREDGAVICWGDNRSGQCDAPSDRFVAVSAGYAHSIGLREDGAVICWGDNRFGQCDAPSDPFVAVSAGYAHSIGLREDGAVICWGDNRFGQCDAPSDPFVTISAGGDHSIGLLEDGRVVGWGDAEFDEWDAPPGRFVAVSAGDTNSLALRDDGTVLDWGDNGDEWGARVGQFVAVDASTSHSIGLRLDGTVTCWGDSGHGQREIPQGRFVAVAAGGLHSVALREDGTVICWGDNEFGQCDAPTERLWSVNLDEQLS